MDRQLLYYLIGILLIFMGMISCTSEEPGVILEGEKITLEVPITRANEANEDQIKNARIIVSHNTGAKRVIVNEDTPFESVPNIKFRVQVPVGYCNIYLIANEKSSWNLGTTLLPGTGNLPAQLKGKVFSYEDTPGTYKYPVVDPSNPIPMFEQYENVYVDKDGNITKDGVPVDLNSSLGTVKRIFSKVTLDLTCVYSQLQNGGDPIELKSVSIKRMPKYSYLGAYQNYPGTQASDFFDGTGANIATDFPFTGPSTQPTGFKGSTYFYIPEYVLSDTTFYTYISMVVNLVGGGTDTEREYKIVVGDGIGIDKNNHLLGPNKSVPDVCITRNTHYKFDITIVSFDKTSDSDLDIIAKIIDWNATNTDDPEPYEYDLSVSHDVFNIVPGGLFEGVVTVITDHKDGWMASFGGSYGSNLTIIEPTNATTVKQYGNKLKFRVASGFPTGSNVWIINVKAGKVNKQIKITRQN